MYIKTREKNDYITHMQIQNYMQFFTIKRQIQGFSKKLKKFLKKNEIISQVIILFLILQMLN